MRILSIKNFERYQHYKNRNPPWIKLYRDLYIDKEFIRLPIEARYLYIGLLILCSECDNRLIEDLDYFEKRLHVPAGKINLGPLMLREEHGEMRGFLMVEGEPVPVVDAAAGMEQKAVPARKPALLGFEAFWKLYPRKVGKGAAERAWAKIRPDEPLRAAIMAAIERAMRSQQWTKDGGQFIPHPATWLNEKRWEDGEATEAQAVGCKWPVKRGYASEPCGASPVPGQPLPFCKDHLLAREQLDRQTGGKDVA
jgi:hypothetical protein